MCGHCHARVPMRTCLCGRTVIGVVICGKYAKGGLAQSPWTGCLVRGILRYAGRSSAAGEKHGWKPCEVSCGRFQALFFFFNELSRSINKWYIRFYCVARVLYTQPGCYLGFDFAILAPSANRRNSFEVWLPCMNLTTLKHETVERDKILGVKE